MSWYCQRSKNEYTGLRWQNRKSTSDNNQAKQNIMSERTIQSSLKQIANSCRWLGAISVNHEQETETTICKCSPKWKITFSGMQELLGCGAKWDWYLFVCCQHTWNNCLMLSCQWVQTSRRNVPIILLNLQDKESRYLRQKTSRKCA